MTRHFGSLSKCNCKLLINWIIHWFHNNLDVWSIHLFCLLLLFYLSKTEDKVQVLCRNVLLNAGNGNSRWTPSLPCMSLFHKRLMFPDDMQWHCIDQLKFSGCRQTILLCSAYQLLAICGLYYFTYKLFYIFMILTSMASEYVCFHIQNVLQGICAMIVIPWFFW